ncbi:hypothetical protein ACIOK4_43760 [Streptomyces bottropensis]|uniref:hypothetical protein n=1 Tax=Streptomyces bottropensis TaxID=42235 RepID=UPI00381EFBBB
MSGGEAPGVDLPRVALRTPMEVARKNGGSQKAKQKPQPVRTGRRDGRKPGLDAAIGTLVTERAWALPAPALPCAHGGRPSHLTSTGTSPRSGTASTPAGPCARSRRQLVLADLVVGEQHPGDPAPAAGALYPVPLDIGARAVEIADVSPGRSASTPIEPSTAPM